MITGATPAKHGIIGNSVFDRETGDQVTYIGDRAFTKDECVRTPTLYDAVHQAGMKTASILWPASKAAKSLDWNIPEPPEELEHYVTPGLAKELDEAGISIGKLPAWGWGHDFAPMRDALYTRVAVHLLARYQPNLTLLHLVTPDAVEHDYGPETEEAYWSAGDADDRIREIWEALQQGPLAGRTDLFVVSDHGFAPVDKQVRPNVLLRKMGFVTLDRKGQVVGRKAWANAAGGSAGVYLFYRENLERDVSRIREQLAGVEGIESVFGQEEFAAFGLPSPEENTQQADLMLSVEPGYGFNNRADGEEVVAATGSNTGTHGHRPNQEFMHAAFVASGPHIRRGVELGVVSIIDVAPTIAAIFGVELPEAEGRVLTELLK